MAASIKALEMVEAGAELRDAFVGERPAVPREQMFRRGIYALAGADQYAIIPVMLRCGCRAEICPRTAKEGIYVAPQALPSGRTRQRRAPHLQHVCGAHARTKSRRCGRRVSRALQQTNRA